VTSTISLDLDRTPQAIKFNNNDDVAAINVSEISVKNPTINGGAF
jgi:hypothetical protein